MAKIYTLCLVFVIVACVNTQEVVQPANSPDEDTVILTEEDNLTNEIVTDPLAVSDATEPAVIEETIPSTDDGEMTETTTSQENQPQTPIEDDEISETANPENVPDVPGEDGEIGDTANEATLPDPPAGDDEINETASPENVPDVPGRDGEIGDTANEATLPDPAAEDDEIIETANPETLPDVPGQDGEIGDTANPEAEDDKINETTSPENLPDPPAEDTAPLPTEEVTSEKPPTTPADNPTETSPTPDATAPQIPSQHTTPVVLTENTIPDRPFPSITISLPTLWPSTVIADSIDTIRPANTHICKENEIFSCLPFCMKTCNNPMSKFLCRPVPNHFRLCRRGCICKMGYLLEHPHGRCVSQCPTRQLF